MTTEFWLNKIGEGIKLGWKIITDVAKETWPAPLIVLIVFLGYLFCRYMYAWWKRVTM